MPRKTKEQKDIENIEKELKKLVEKKSTKKPTKTTGTKSKAKKATDTKAVATKKVVSNFSVAKKTTKKTSTASKEKLATAKIAKEKKDTTTKKATKKATTKTVKKTTAKTTNKKAISNKKALDVVEYYDLPYRYNQTVVKLLAQTPTNLFIYWDISDADRENYKKEYGENFFETTKPVLIVYNDTLGYNFEVDINDFANSWYLHVNDAKCDYRVELGRRPITYNEKINIDYIYVTASNEIESPNDRILFDRSQKMVYFRNVKTGDETPKELASLSFIRNMGKIYNVYDIYDMYKEIYKDENIEELYDLSNPSSGNPSSGSLSSSKFN